MSGPTVNIKQGVLRGKISENADGAKFYSFHGIPYAAPPVGELRFKAPRPPLPWNGTRDATEEAEPCFSRHMIFQNIIGSEDCLFLNVHTKVLPQSGPKADLKPVMVWIHGGGFIAGSSNMELYGPEFLLREDIVFVSINYRLGALGFLSLEDTSLEVPGNAAFKDMTMALRWVQENIEHFGGNKNNVTIFGESAGGAAVHYLILSPMTKGLFHKAIIQSGCALNLWAVGTQCAEELALLSGFKSKNEKELLKHLQTIPVDDLLDAQYKIKDTFHADEIRPHGPVIEKPSLKEEAFLTQAPIDIICNGTYNKVPIMIGYTSREGMLFDIMEKRSNISHLVTNFENAIPRTINLKKGSAQSENAAKKIQDFYYGKEEPSLENREKYHLLQTDNFFLRGIHSTIKNHINSSTQPLFYYRFGVETSLNFYKIIGEIKQSGACHADDLGYLFHMQVTPEIIPNSAEDLTIRRMCKLWTTFAIHGDPNPKEPCDLINVTWPAAQIGNHHYLDIGDNLSVGINPENARMKLWDEIYGLNPLTSKL